jgi:hypothetical protein
MIELEFFFDNGTRVVSPRIDTDNVEGIIKAIADGDKIILQKEGKSVFFAQGERVLAVAVFYNEV